MNSKVTILEKDHINQISGVATVLKALTRVFNFLSVVLYAFSPANLYGQKNNKVLKLNNYLIQMQ